MSVLTEMFAFQIKHSQFPVHVDGGSIGTLSNVTFGRPDLDGRTTQEQFPSKEVDRPKLLIYPAGHVLCEQGTLIFIFTMKKGPLK